MFLLLFALSSSINQLQTPRIFRHKKHIARSTEVSESPLCPICTDIVDQIEQLLQDKQLEEEILQYILQYCQKLPAPYSSLCGAYIEQGISVVISYIEQGLETLDICAKLGLCDPVKSKKIRSEPIIKPIRHRSSLPNDGFISCTVCKEAVQFVKRQLEKEQVQTNIAALVSGLCDRIPVEFQKTCKSLTTEYVPIAMKLIDDNLNSDELCTSFGLCATQSNTRHLRRRTPINQEKYVPVTPIPLPPNFNKATGCDMCNKLINYIKNLLTDKTVEDEIAKLVSQTCDVFDTPYSSVCHSLVQEYLPVILVWIEGGITAADICTKTGLC